MSIICISTPESFSKIKEALAFYSPRLLLLYMGIFIT
jgi:hypothetical protein